jgi:tripartite ATP-independent transporter DctM subunit
MDSVTVGILGFLIFFTLMALGVPIAFSMGMVGFFGIWYLGDLTAALSTVGMLPFSWGADYTFMCIPLFVLMGHFANRAGVITKFFDAAYKWAGSLPGGLAIATTLASGAFGAVSGSSSASAATMSTICIPEMKKYNYNRRLMTGSVAMGGTLAILIPPSLGFVIYGIITEESIGKLFVAGILPGIMMVFLNSLVIYFMCKTNPTLGPPGPPSTLGEKIISLKGSWEILVIFLAVIGGMYSGVFTPTEGAAVGCFITFAFSLAKRKLARKEFMGDLATTAKVTLMIFMLIIGAMVFNQFMALTGISEKLRNYVVTLTVNPYLALTFILFTYFIAGCIMDSVAMAFLLLPIYYPIIIALGFNGIWFGVIGTVMAEIGLLTPPIGLNCFVVHGVFPEYPLEEIFRGIWPFVAMDIVIVIILILFPQISLFLPSFMGKR